MAGVLEDLDYEFLIPDNKDNKTIETIEKQYILDDPSIVFLERIKKNYVDKVYNFSKDIAISVYKFQKIGKKGKKKF